ncbi:MAG: hypothetical protein DSZ25_03480 [Thermovibrio sp.]|nr:MAG: hypothetical protein DSZ25_03480 [Thermovibrio sp.]
MRSGTSEKGVGFLYRKKREGMREFAERVSLKIEELLKLNVVQKISDCVLLVPSARERDGSFVKELKEVLEKRGFKVYNPRSKNFGKKERIRKVLNYLLYVVEGGLSASEVPEELLQIREEFKERKIGLLDAYYRIISHLGVINSKSPEELFDFSHLSQFLSQFEKVYSFDEIPEKFSSVFIPFLNSTDEPEIPPEYLPDNYLPVMTIHQSKGLEFPVVFLAVDNLWESDKDEVLELLRDFVPDSVRELLPPVEDVESIKRKLFVAYSRARDILVIVDGRKENREASPNSSLYLEGEWEKMKVFLKGKGAKVKDFMGSSFSKKSFMRPNVYSFTGDIVSFQICPKLYAMRKFFGFSPTSSVQEWFGTAIHRTLRFIYIFYREKGRVPSREEISEIFERVCNYLKLDGIEPPDEERRKTALEVVRRFVEREGKEFYPRLKGVEQRVSIEKDGFFIQGIMDAVLKTDGGLEIWDFKSMRHPKRKGRDRILELYKKQLMFYKLLMGSSVKRLVLYFLNELLERDPREREVFYPEGEEEFWSEIRKVIERIEECRRNREWPYSESPDENTCRVCDFRYSCPTWNVYNSQN